MSDPLVLLAWCDPERRHVRWSWAGIWVGLLVVDQHRLVYHADGAEKFSAPMAQARFVWRGSSKMTAARFDLHLPEAVFRLYLSPPSTTAPQPDPSLMDHIGGALDRISAVSLLGGTLGTLGDASGVLDNALSLPGAVTQLRSGHRAAEELRTFLGATAPVTNAGGDGSPPATGLAPRFVRGDQQTWATTVRFSLGGCTVACAHSDGSVRLWNTRVGTSRRHLQPFGRSNVVHDLAFAGAGRVILSAGEDHCVRLQDIVTGAEVARLTHPDDVRRVCVDIGGRWAATVCEDMTARIWDLRTTKLVRTVEVDCAHSMLFAPTGSGFVVSDIGGEISYFPSPDAACTGRTEKGEGVVDCLALSDDGRLAVGDSEAGVVTLFSCALDRVIGELRHSTPIACGTFSPSGRSFLGGDEEGNIVLWNLGTGQCVLRLPHQSRVESVDWDRRTGLIATGTLEGLTVWDLRDSPADGDL
ncbi:WD40 repeat domain-containing protein [Streptomyces apricus]|uniref:Uncharacterized protein n=1 Tax=Streptomyces apricus TaxID=1828112 RepID=A0A5B0B035_9ACTN|nr:hypothetical protein [Streptomyces apricus]KAA0935508.1 hypothetical protein FGF04_15720 [Streptomyces apricus]